MQIEEINWNQRRFLELDSLRAFAVLTVVWSHSSVINIGITGFHGVLLFFVISGFLITGILLDARAKNSLPRSVLRAFYARRFLRIFPIYYAVLFVALITGLLSTSSAIGWHLAYLSNWYFAHKGFDQFSALWSLAVEEQFYLVWAWLVILMPPAALPWTIIAMIVAGPVSRLTIGSLTPNDLAPWITTPTVLDALGLGCLLAYLWRQNPEAADRLARWAFVSGVLLIGVEKGRNWLGIPAPAGLAIDTLGWRLVCVWLVHRAGRGVNGKMGQLLRARQLVYVGIISYGIYLLHLLTVVFLSKIEQRLSIQLLAWDKPGRFVAVALTSIAAAALSWKFFERPINSLKDRFPYVPIAQSGGEESESQCRANPNGVLKK
jgi:peptidoglycan/LPS O-acetylase OafA/YrhL